MGIIDFSSYIHQIIIIFEPNTIMLDQRDVVAVIQTCAKVHYDGF